MRSQTRGPQIVAGRILATKRWTFAIATSRVAIYAPHGLRLAIIALDHHFELIILHTKPHGQLLPEFFDLVIQRDGL